MKTIFTNDGKKAATDAVATKARAVSVKTAAQMLECSEKSVRRLIERGLLKPCRVLRVLRIPVDQIEQMLHA